MRLRVRPAPVLAAVGILAGGVALAALPAAAPVRDGAARLLLAPGAALGAAARGLATGWRQAPDADSARLREERDALVLENARLRGTAQEAEELRALLAYRERSGQEPVAARVIGRTSDLGLDGLLIDRGTDDGVGEGMAVIAGDGFYLGLVRQAGPTTAVVLLGTDSRHRVAAMLQNGTRSIGYVEGGRGLGMAMRLIPQDERVDAGQLVVTSGLDPAIPRGLVIGRVERVTRAPQEPFQTAVVSPMVAADRQSFVAVVRVTTPDAL